MIYTDTYGRKWVREDRPGGVVLLKGEGVRWTTKVELAREEHPAFRGLRKSGEDWVRA